MSDFPSLAQVEALYGSLLETLPAIVYLAEPLPPYASIYVSGHIHTLGYSREEWMSRPDIWVSSLHEEDRGWVLAQTEDVMRAGRENDYEYRVHAKDGTIRWLHDRGRFVRNADGTPLVWQGVLLDITARKEMEDERETLIRKLRAALTEIKTLSGLLPICSYCHRVRDDRDYWQGIDHYIAAHSATQFTHGICPDCYASHVVPDLAAINPPPG